jgi:hypothetical protein
MTLGTSEPNDTNRGKEMRFMRRIIMALILACLVAFAVGGAAWVLVAPPAKAAFPGQNGRIVFYREDSDGFAQTWVADKDLSNQVKLTSESVDSGWAVWKQEVPNWPSSPIAPIQIPPTGMRSTTSSR